MLGKFIKHIIEGNAYQGLEVFEIDGKKRFALLVLENRKGELEVLSQRTTDDPNELPSLVEKKKPLFITFNTAKVLKKQVPTEILNNPELAVVNTYPNLELNNFYYELLEGKKNTVVSISKKDYINEHLEQFEKMGMKPFQIALGISNVQVLEGFANENLTGSNFEIQLEESIFHSYIFPRKNTSVSVHLDGISFKNHHLLGFAQILTFLKQKVQPSNLLGINQTLSRKFKNNKWFGLGMNFGLGFFLVLLLTNFLIFNHYHIKNQEFETSIANNQNQNDALMTLQESVSNKEKRLESILNSKNSETSYYLDELGKTIPSSMSLNLILYQPLITPPRDKEAINFNENHLQIHGVTNDGNQFSVWMDHLATLRWVSRVEIVDYEYVSKSSANFTLKVILDPNGEKE